MKLLRAFLTLGFGLGDILGIVSSGLGIAKGAKDLAGNAGTKAYVPQGLGAADDTFQQILAQLAGGAGGAASAITPEIANAFRSLLGIDTGGLTGAGQAAGAQYGNVAGQASDAGGYQLGLGRGVGDAGRQLWETSLDPQNALRDATQQRITDASRAGTSARGIGMSGEAAGIENQAVSDFLMNWENNRLQRQATGLQGYGNAANQSGRSQAGGLGMGTLGAESALNAGQVPFNTNYQAAGLPFQAAGQYNSALGGTNQNLGGILASIIPYLNQGQGATAQGFTQGQIGLNNLTTGLGQFGNGSGGFSGAGDWLSNLYQSGGNNGGFPTGSWDMGGGNWAPENSFGGG